MKKENLIIPGTVLVILIIFFALFYAFGGFNNNTASESNIYQTKTSEEEVTIDLTPREYKDGKFYVDIGVNTHTVSLEQFDLKQLVKLDYSSTSINPVLAPELSGHHNSGVLVFNVDKEPRNFRIIIRGIPDVEERIFEW